MGYKSGHDCIMWGSSAARDGLTACVIAAGETWWPANGAPAVGTQVFPKQDAAIIRAGWISEAVANADEYRWHTTDDPNWIRTSFFKADQTADWEYEKVMMPVNYYIKKGQAIALEIDNDANAQGEWLMMNIANKPDNEIKGVPWDGIPKSARWVDFDSAANSVADTVTRIGLTPVNFSFDREGVYRVYGVRAQSATGVLWRLVALDSDDRPGGPMCDTEICGASVFFKPFALEFNGLQGLWADILSAGAEASTWSILIDRVK